MVLGSAITWHQTQAANISISNDAWNQVVNTLDRQELMLVKSSCIMTSSPLAVPVNTPYDCRKASATVNNVQVGNRYGLQAVFELDTEFVLSGPWRTFQIYLVDHRCCDCWRCSCVDSTSGCVLHHLAACTLQAEVYAAERKPAPFHSMRRPSSASSHCLIPI